MDRMSHEIMSLSIPTLFRRIMGKDCAGYLIDIRNDEEAANADRESDIRRLAPTISSRSKPRIPTTYRPAEWPAPPRREGVLRKIPQHEEYQS
jgi:hypothetical protein